MTVYSGELVGNSSQDGSLFLTRFAELGELLRVRETRNKDVLYLNYLHWPGIL